MQHKEGFYGYPVNRWSIKRPPNGTKLYRRSIGGVPRPLGKSRPIPRTFFCGSQNKNWEVPRARASVVGLRMDNRENWETRADASFQKHADEMQVKT